MAAALVVVQLVPGVPALPGLPVGTSPAMAVDPVPPPGAVVPDPYMRVVEDAGPTSVSGTITTDTVWGPQGSPYIVGVTTVASGVALTLLPGTVVKMDLEAALTVEGQILALGTPDDQVVFTSVRDDTILGDTNGDGDATSPARGDWVQISIASGGGDAVSVFDYTEVRYGGNELEGCVTWGALNIVASRAVVANSRFVDVQTGVRISGSTGSGYAGVYNSHFVSGRCGLSLVNSAHAEVVGNTFDDSFIDLAVDATTLGRTRFWFNTVHGSIEVYNVLGEPPSAEEADFRFNALLGPLNDRPSWLGLHPMTAWSLNWFGHDANDVLPTCMDPDVAADAIPPIETQPSEECPSGQEEVVGYLDTVLPALSGSPQVLPASAREAAAPRFGPVNTYTGALTYEAADLHIEDAGKRVTATRTFRSDQLTGGDAGMGWTSAFSESLSQSGDLATLTFSDGSSLGFLTDPAAGYVPAPGVAATFATDAAGTTVTTPSQTGYHFDVNGELSRLTLGDEGHELAVERSDGAVNKVVGESGRYLEFGRVGGRLDSIADHAGSSVTLAYAGSRLTGATGVDGQTETYSYDTAGRLTRVTTPEGRVRLAAEYGPDGRVVWVEQQGAGRATFAYDDANATRTITLADGTVITQKHDWAGRLLTERVGRTGAHVVYDGEGRPVSRITGVPDMPMVGFSPAAPVTLYDRSGDPVVEVDPTGRSTTTTFDERHQPLVTTGRDGSTVTRTYDGDGRLATLTDPLDSVWTYTYNDRGQVLTQTDPLARVRTLTYDTNGDLTSVTDEAGATTTYGYNPVGRRVSVTDPLGNQTQIEYAAWGDIRQVTRPRGGVATITFDGDRQPASLTNEVGAVTSYGYDTAGRLTSVNDALSNTTSIEYDLVGRAVRATDGRGSVYEQTYSAEGWVASTTDPLGNVTSYEIDPLGRVVRETDPLGQITQTAYDRAGRVTRHWTPDGALWRYGYDQMGRHSTTTTPRNHNWTMAYDLAGRLLTTTDPEGFSVSTTYDEVGRTVTTTDQEGAVTSYVYDDALRTTTATDALGTLWVEARDAAGQAISRQDGSGVTTAFGYDDDGNLVEITDPAGTTTADYDLAGQPITETDPTGLVTTAGYDLLGRVATLTHPDGGSEAFTYDPAGNLATHTDQGAAVWSYGYDAANRLTSETDPLGGETTITYDELGRQTSVTDPAGVVQNAAYDPMGRPAVRWDASGGSWVTGYDLDGNVVEETAPDGVSITHSVDSRGLRTSTVWGSVLNEFTYSYDGVGRLVGKSDPYQTAWTYDVRGRVETVTDAEDNMTLYEYDGAGRRISETLPSGRETTWAYDPAGRLATAVDGLGNTSGYAYDAAGRLTAITLPRGGQYDYTYDGAGRLSSETDPLGATTSYSYDLAGRLTGVMYPSGRMVESGYDAAGRRTSVTAGGVIREFGYDPAGRFTSAAVGGNTISYDYDDRGLLQTQNDATGETSYAYDLVGRIISRAPPAGEASTFTYDSRGLLDTVDGPVKAFYTHNNAGQITRIAASSLSSTQPENRSYDSNGRLVSVHAGAQYEDEATYTVDGQVASISRWVPGSTERHTTEYTYNGAGRLDTATTSDGTTVLSTTDYDWDADGNRIAVDTSGEPAITATFDAANRLIATSDGTTYTHDDDGYLTAAGDDTYTYNPFGELTAAATPTESVTYARDALGRLASRSAEGTGGSYTYDGTSATLLGSMSTGDTYTQVVRDSAGLTLGEAIVDGSTRWARYNVHGDIARFHNQRCSLFGECGPGTTVIWAAQYDPFGDQTLTTGAAPPVSLGFQAMFTEPVTGQVDMGARTYDPPTGRFTQPDTVIGDLTTPISLNRYLYAHGDPLSMFDPDGQWPRWLNDIASFASDLLTQASKLVDQTFRGIGDSFAGIGSQFSQAASSVGNSLATLAAEASATIADFWDRHRDRIQSTLTGVAVGAAIVGGCVALGVATAGLGGAVCAGAALGAVFGGALCDLEHRTVAGCVTTGAIAGGVAGLTGGVAAGGGASGFTVGALSGLTGDATEQLLSTGRIDTQRLAFATLTGGALGYLGSRLAARFRAPAGSATLARPLDLPTAPRRLAIDGPPRLAIEGPPARLAVTAAPARRALPAAPARTALPPAAREAPNAPGPPIFSRIAYPGEQFNMVLSRGQVRPGGFGTFDDIPSQSFARLRLAIRTDWKADVSLVQRYQVPVDGPPIRIQESVVGSQHDPILGLLPGGARQLEIINYQDRARLIPIGLPMEIM